MEYVIDFKNLGMKDVEKVGGKNASLGEMICNLSQAGVKIPPGFAVTTIAYKKFLIENKIDKKIYDLLKKLDVKNITALKKTSKQIKKMIFAASFSPDLISAVTASYKNLLRSNFKSFAVRSSANAEDSKEASFAGQQETYLNISGIGDIFKAIKAVYASLFGERSIVYRVENKFEHSRVGISAGIQGMVRSDIGASGVMFTLDTESGFDKVVFINASYGLGESVVQGVVNPDEFYVYKPNLLANKPAILQRNLGDKATKIIYQSGHTKQKFDAMTKTVSVFLQDRGKFCLSDKDVEDLAKQALLIEKHYQMPMDIEWAKDGATGKLFIVQARPETVKSREKMQVLEHFSLKKTGEIIIKGHSVGEKIGQGNARVITDPKKMLVMKKGEVLVADMTDPDWEPIMKLASAIVTNRGGRTCHAAIVARELGIPAVVGCNDATRKIKQGVPITVSCAEGEIGNVYKGILPIKVEHIKVQDLAKPKVKLCLNLADPDKAFAYQFLPNDGVGLLRMEFIISNTIGIHPKAILEFAKIPKKVQQKILQLTKSYKNPKEFYIEKLCEGLSTIAAAFYPKPVIIRFSDFKSNEYANLIGGEFFEPKEENPMIGFRGGSRYVSDFFADCFALECEAVKRMRNKMNLTNAEIMLPFVRTISEVKSLILSLEKNGLKRGENGLRVIMMCEIPSNALLAEDFLQYCDGFSIGSNDLTQLTLGLDRDSDLVASLFDERNKAVKLLLHQAIVACNKQNKYIGICGQAPSDYPDLAKWLMDEGIKAISLTPDSIIKTWLFLSK